jgi:NitT/TauT family transport system substrate-binding protein
MPHRARHGLAPLLLGLLLAACAAPAATPVPTAPAGGVAAPTATPAPTAARPERDHIKVIYGSVSGSMAPLWLADERGLFQQYGLSVDVQYAESTVGIAALVAGEAQIALNEGVTVMRAIAAGSPLKIVAVFNKLNPYAVVARPEIRTPADLRGKTIALLRPGDTTDVSARLALERHGLVVGEDVQPLQSGNSPSRLAALVSGRVDAALLSEAFVERAVAEGMHVLVSLENERLPYISTGVMLRTDFGRESPNTVIAFLQAVIEGYRFFNDPANRDAVLPVMARQLQRDVSDPAVWDAWAFYHDRLARDPYPEPEGAATLIGALRSIDPALYGSLTPEQVLDPSYMAALRASGFLERIWGR